MMWTTLLFVYFARSNHGLTATLSGEASGQSLSIDCGSDTIQIVSSSYGVNCNADLFNNQLVNLQTACSGLSSCSYTVNHHVIGDPAFGCAKTYEYQYQCVSDVQQGSVSSEASGQSLSIDCTGSKIRVLEASYGKNCIAALYNNQLGNLEDACNGRETCDYTVDHHVIGDPSVGCAKTYDYQYQCDDRISSASLMEGSLFDIECGSAKIEILSATYGLNCNVDLFNNHRVWLDKACSGKSACSYTASNSLSGDPAPNCRKSYDYDYECKSDDADASVSAVDEVVVDKAEPVEVEEVEMVDDVEEVEMVDEVKVDVYRYWNGGNSDHFYTTNVDEIGTAVSGEVGNFGYKSEAVGFVLLDASKPAGDDAIELFRYWNAGNSDHFYTTNADEIGTTSSGEVGKFGYKSEAVLGRCFADGNARVGLVPLYRYWHGANGDHFYTTNFQEIGTVTAGETGNYGYKYEGIACYVFATVNTAENTDLSVGDDFDSAQSDGNIVINFTVSIKEAIGVLVIFAVVLSNVAVLICKCCCGDKKSKKDTVSKAQTYRKVDGETSITECV